MEPKKAYKVFRYQTNVLWKSGRRAVISSAGKPAIEVSSPPEFKGEAGFWTPEDMFVASINLCTLMTFVAFAQRQELDFVSYESAAEGVIENVEGKVPLHRGRRSAARDRQVRGRHRARPQAHGERPQGLPGLQLSHHGRQGRPRDSRGVKRQGSTLASFVKVPATRISGESRRAASSGEFCSTRCSGRNPVGGAASASSSSSSRSRGLAWQAAWDPDSPV